MDWLWSNWVWIVFGIAMIAMHMFGHGRHGGHTRHGPERAIDAKNPRPTEHAHAVDTVPNAANSNDPAALGVPARKDPEAPELPKDRGRHRGH